MCTVNPPERSSGLPIGSETVPAKDSPSQPELARMRDRMTKTAHQIREAFQRIRVTLADYGHYSREDRDRDRVIQKIQETCQQTVGLVMSTTPSTLWFREKSKR